MDAFVRCPGQPAGRVYARRSRRHPAAGASPVASRAHADAVVFDHVYLAFDDREVLKDLSFTIPRGEMRILLGASGSGKSVLLKVILGLLRPDSGSVIVQGERIDQMREAELLRVRAGIGMVFQENALFDSLTVAENVGFQLVEAGRCSSDDIDRRVREVLGFVGLHDFADRLPAELSGGQRRRVAIARAMAAKPALLLFDDPTTGLDPVIATSIVDEIVKLRDLEQVTSLVVTHQIRDAFYVATHQALRVGDGVTIATASDAKVTRARFMVLRDGRIGFEGTGAELLASCDPYLEKFLLNALPPW